MAKKKTAQKMTGKKVVFTWHSFVPAVVGGIIVWLFSGSFTLAVEVLLVVVVASWVVRKYGHK